jgi:hypothetical protein
MPKNSASGPRCGDMNPVTRFAYQQVPADHHPCPALERRRPETLIDRAKPDVARPRLSEGGYDVAGERVEGPAWSLRSCREAGRAQSHAWAPRFFLGRLGAYDFRSRLVVSGGHGLLLAAAFVRTTPGAGSD